MSYIVLHSDFAVLFHVAYFAIVNRIVSAVCLLSIVLPETTWHVGREGERLSITGLNPSLSLYLPVCVGQDMTTTRVLSLYTNTYLFLT